VNLLTSQLLASTPTLRGAGLFTGVDCAVTFHPAPRGAGIVFRDAGSGRTVRALAEHAAIEREIPNVPRGFPVRNTTLSLDEGGAIATVEHAMSALRGLGVCDCVVDVEGPEVPIFDGSALALVEALVPVLGPGEAGPDPIELREPVTIREGGASITATPTDSGVSYTYALDYGPDSPIPPQTASWSGDPEEYRAEIAPARTFSLEREAAVANALGLFSRFRPRDLLVIGNDGRPIDNTWRFENEPARHKLLDLIGDVGLLGGPVRASIAAERSGHAMTRRFCLLVSGARDGGIVPGHSTG
jgi:UDP-3-O-acyl-N-acetylglucosamine deacetylase